MKLLISILFVLLMLSGCRSTKITSQSSNKTENKSEVVQKNDVVEETKVDNDKNTYKKTTIVETEYDTDYSEPTKIDNSNANLKPNNEVLRPDKPIAQQDEKPRIKSTKTTIIEEGTVDKSKIETKKSDKSQVSTKTEDKSETDKKDTQKKSSSFPWFWFLWSCFGLSFCVFIYFSKSKIALTIKAFIKKIFA